MNHVLIKDHEQSLSVNTREGIHALEALIPSLITKFLNIIKYRNIDIGMK